jgi:uncharacterized delta-60 repeat protein
MRVSSIVAAVVVGALASSVAWAVDGDLDPSFGTNGGYTYLGESGIAFQLPMRSAVLADGRILTCGGVATSSSGDDFLVALLTADGELDTSFNFNGKATVDFGGNNDICNTVVVQSDGKILLIGSGASTGTSGSDFALARLNADGTLDTTFGAGSGRATVGFDLGGMNTDYGAHAVLQPDNKIVVAGIAEAATGYDFAITRLMQDGSRDTSFGVAGRVTVDFNTDPGSLDQADSVALDDQGRIVVGGIAYVNGGSDFAFVRLLPNGTLDANFNGDGKATIPFDLGNTNGDISYRTIVTYDQKIVMVGGADTGTSSTNNDFAIARVLPNGSLDMTFGVGGKTVIPFDITANGNDVATDIVESANGSLIVVGAVAIDGSGNSAGGALRLTSNGALDDSFGVFGKETHLFGSPTFLLLSTVLQGTQVIATGINGPGADIAVARLSIDSIFANGFEP